MAKVARSTPVVGDAVDMNVTDGAAGLFSE
jgi:hypothetical protein